MIKTQDLLSHLVDRLRDTGTISSISHSGNIYKIFTLDTKSLEVGWHVTIGTTDYKILSFATDTYLGLYFTVKSTKNVSGSIWKAKAPYFFYWTPLEVSNELNPAPNDIVYPCVVLFEPIPNSLSIDPTTNTNQKPQCEIVFMGEAQYANWTEAQPYYDYVINKLQVWVNRFLDDMRYSPYSKYINFYEMLQGEQKAFEKWGRYKPNESKSIFNDELSGIDLKITIPICQTFDDFNSKDK